MLRKFNEFEDYVNDIHGAVGDHQLQAGMTLEKDGTKKKMVNHCHNHDLTNLSKAIISNICDVDPENWQKHQESGEPGRKVTHDEYQKFIRYSTEWKHIYLKDGNASQSSKGKSLQASLVGQLVSEKFPESLDYYCKVTRRKEIYEWTLINGRYTTALNTTKLNSFKQKAKIFDLPAYNEGNLERIIPKKSLIF